MLVVVGQIWKDGGGPHREADSPTPTAKEGKGRKVAPSARRPETDQEGTPKLSFSQKVTLKLSFEG